MQKFGLTLAHPYQKSSLKLCIWHYNLKSKNRSSNYSFDKTIWKVKDEMKGKIIEEFVGLAPKSYSIIIFEDDKEIKKTKGIIIKNRITRDDYKTEPFYTKIN